MNFFLDNGFIEFLKNNYLNHEEFFIKENEFNNKYYLKDKDNIDKYAQSKY